MEAGQSAEDAESRMICLHHYSQTGQQQLACWRIHCSSSMPVSLLMPVALPSADDVRSLASPPTGSGSSSRGVCQQQCDAGARPSAREQQASERMLLHGVPHVPLEQHGDAAADGGGSTLEEVIRTNAQLVESAGIQSLFFQSLRRLPHW